MERRGRRGSDQELRLPGVGKGGRATNLGIGRRGASPEVVFRFFSRVSYRQPTQQAAWDPSPAAAFGRDVRFASLGWHTTGLMRRAARIGRQPKREGLPGLLCCLPLSEGRRLRRFPSLNQQ